MRYTFLLLTILALSGCGGGNGGSPKPPPVTTPAWFSLPAGFFHYAGNASEPHYVVKSISGLSQAGRVVMTYTVSGTGPLVALDGGSPPTVSFIIWRSGDNLTCQGVMQQYRYFSGTRGPLTPGTHTLEVPIDPARWTDCYGKPGTDFPDRFQGAVAGAYRVGFGFGGWSAGHGVRAPQGGVQFTVQSFSP